MVVGWDFEYTDGSGRTRTTRTSHTLLNEVTYPVLVSSLIDDSDGNPHIDGLFIRRWSALDDESDEHDEDSTVEPTPTASTQLAVATQLTDENLAALIRFVGEGERQGKIITISSTARYYKVAGWGEDQVRRELVRLTNDGVFRQVVEDIDGNSVRRLYLTESHPVVAEVLGSL